MWWKCGSSTGDSRGASCLQGLTTRFRRCVTVLATPGICGVGLADPACGQPIIPQHSLEESDVRLIDEGEHIGDYESSRGVDVVFLRPIRDQRTNVFAKRLTRQFLSQV